MKLRKFTALLLALLTAAAVLTGCDTAADSGADAVLGSGGKTLRIVSGSENRELEPILEDFAKSEGVRIEMTYQGSLDIMRLLEGEELPYDAVWPASSLWLDAADTSLNLSTPNPFPSPRWCSASGKAWPRSWVLWARPFRWGICWSPSAAGSCGSA